MRMLANKADNIQQHYVEDNSSFRPSWLWSFPINPLKPWRIRMYVPENGRFMTFTEEGVVTLESEQNPHDRVRLLFGI